MTHTPVFSMMLDDFNTMVNVEELEPIEGIEMERLFNSIIGIEDVIYDEIEDIDYEEIF